MSFDMYQCKIGDLLVSKHGMILTYEGDSGQLDYPHQVRYPNGGGGTRCNDGTTYLHNKRETDHDIIGFAKDYYGDILK
jgi:hypothetical protein